MGEIATQKAPSSFAIVKKDSVERNVSKVQIPAALSHA